MGLSSLDFNRLKSLIDSCKTVTAMAQSIPDNQMGQLTHELSKIASRVVMRYAHMMGLNPAQIDPSLRLRGFQLENPWTANCSPHSVAKK